MSTDHKAPHYTVLSTLLLPCPFSGPNIILIALNQCSSMNVRDQY